MRFAFILMIAAMLSGCMANQLQTASGKPEVFIPRTTVDAVKSEIVSGLTTRGFRVTRDSQYELTFDKAADGPAALLYGSRYDPVPVSRVSFYFATMADGVKVSADVSIVTNPGSAFEKRTDTSMSPDGKVVQDGLNQLAEILDPASSRGKAKARGIVMGVQTADIADAHKRGLATGIDEGVYVVGVTPNMPAAKAGILKGDVIQTWNGKPVTSDADLGAALAAADKGKAIPVTVVRGADEVALSVSF